MEAVEITCCRKFYIYFFLAFNIFISLVILLLLFLSTYDVVFLDWYQYMYLVLATMVWLLLFIVYVGKLVLIIIGKLPNKYLKLVWIVLNSPAIVFSLIGFIYDLVMYTNEQINLLLYLLLYWVIWVLFLVFTIFDFFHIKYQILLSDNSKCKSSDNKPEEPMEMEVKTYQRAESVNCKIKSN